jgi:RND superfamily putative drug exporter
MLDRLANLVLRKPRAVLLVTLLLVLCAGGPASGLMKRLTMGGYESGLTESHKAGVALQDTFKQGDPNLVLLVTDPRGVDAPAVVQAGQALTARLAREPGVESVVSYWSSGKAAALRGRSGGSALVLGSITGDFDTVLDRIGRLQRRYTGNVDGLQVKVGGSALMWRENTQQASKDVAKADSIVFPFVLVVLTIIFGGLIAASLPLAVAFATMLLAMLLLWTMTFFVEASNFVVNITTFLGLGLAIDYSLLFLTRYREELRRGLSVPEAIRVTMRTAGRTVTFSAVTMSLAFVSMLILPFTMFSSLAVGAVVTALLAAATTVVVVPAMLCWLGPRVDRLRLIRRRERPENDGNGFWHRTATFVMRRPVRVVTVVLAVLVVLGLPALGMNLRLPDEQILPKSAQSARVVQAMRAEFSSAEQQPLRLVAQGVGDPASRTAEIDSYAKRLSGLANVARVDALTGSYAGGAQVAQPTPGSRQFAAPSATYLSVVPAVDGYSDAGERLVRDLRAAPAPFPVIVGGAPAVSVDTFDLLRARLPLAGAILVVGMFVLLFLLTGSVLLPIKAMVLSALSLTATFGALVFIFQHGHLRWLVGDFIVTGALTWTVPVLVFAVAFGLSMDYEVFMLSRIKEEHDRTNDNVAAVATGLERIGRVVTYAALLLSIVFLVLVTSSISYMKAIGVGLPLAILMDATLIRGALLPAFMRLVGRGNWWAPRPLRALHARFGIREHVPSLQPPPVPALDSRSAQR